MSLADLIKSASVKAMESTNPVNLIFGKVSQEAPLEIEIHQKLTLTKEFLVLTERVTRYEVNLEHDHAYKDDGADATTGKSLKDLLLKDFPVRTGLKKGDTVVLARVQGGQKFIVLDKVVDA